MKELPEEMSRQFFEMNMKLVEAHPWYESFKDELEDILDKCLTYKSKFETVNCYLSTKIDEMEQMIKETGGTIH